MVERRRWTKHRFTLEGSVILTLSTLLQVPKETAHSRGVGAGSSRDGWGEESPELEALGWDKEGFFPVHLKCSF